MKENAWRTSGIRVCEVLIFDSNAALGRKDAGSVVVVRSLAARCLGGGTVWVCLCGRE